MFIGTAKIVVKVGDRGWVRSWLGLVVALVLVVQGPTAADEPCPRKPFMDPRSGRLQVLDIQVARQGIVGRVKNSSGETALGVMVWVNYYLGRHGGLTAQQCIRVGDLKPGEERGFQASPIPEAERAQAYDYAVDATGWR